MGRRIGGGRQACQGLGRRGGSLVALRNLQVGKGGRQNRRAVSDQGDGLTPAEQDRVFERFYRVDAARSRHTGGTGLGLSIVKHIVGNHGGEVTLWSAPKMGSTFTVRLPQLSNPTSDGGTHRGADRHPGLI